jgi:hypothetical protein
VVTVVVGFCTAGIGAAAAFALLGTTEGIMAGAVIGAVCGAMAGFAGAFVGAILAGGSFGSAFSAGLTGAAWGALSGAASGAIGGALGHQTGEFWTEVARAAAHGVSSGVIDEIRGGSFTAGFASGFFSSAATHGLGLDKWDIYAGTTAAAVIGGTASVIGGGKFENGAMYGAFQYLYNAMGDKLSSDSDKKVETDDDAVKAQEEYDRILLAAQAWFKDNKDNYSGGYCGSRSYQCMDFANDAVNFINMTCPDLQYWYVNMNCVNGSVAGRFGHGFVYLSPIGDNPLSARVIEVFQVPSYYVGAWGKKREIWRNNKVDDFDFSTYKTTFFPNGTFTMGN